MGDDGLLARMGGLVGSNMVHCFTFSVPITGWQHSTPFKSGQIVPHETVVYAFRERGAFSVKEGREFEVRAGDTQAVVLSLQDRDPSDGGMTQSEWDRNQAGYFGFGTPGRAAAAELLDSPDIGPHVKIVAVYSDIDHKLWIQSDGKGRSGCNGRAYVFVHRDKQNDLGPTMQDILIKYNVV